MMRLRDRPLKIREFLDASAPYICVHLYNQSARVCPCLRAYHYLFGFEHFGMHIMVTATMAATLALVAVLTMALDYPFRGEISVAPDPFIMTQRSWTGLSFDKK